MLLSGFKKHTIAFSDYNYYQKHIAVYYSEVLNEFNDDLESYAVEHNE